MSAALRVSAQCLYSAYACEHCIIRIQKLMPAMSASALRRRGETDVDAPPLRSLL